MSMHDGSTSEHGLVGDLDLVIAPTGSSHLSTDSATVTVSVTASWTVGWTYTWDWHTQRA